jgi:hypothetical protein
MAVRGFPATLRYVPAAALLVAGVLMTAATLWFSYGPGSSGLLWDGDWMAVWSAGRLATRDAAAPYQPVFLNEVIHAVTHGAGNGVWGYPPTYFLIAVPLSKFSPLVSDVFFQIAASCLLLAASRRAGTRTFASVALALSPAVIMSFCMGQNGALTGALTAGGLCVAAEAPLRGGMLLGFATFKPHLLILEPICLVAARNRRAAMAMLATALATAMAATVAFGTGAWHAMLTLSPVSMARVIESLPQDRARILVVSPLESLVAAGLPFRAAGAVQAIVTLACIVVAWKAWRRPDVDRPALVGLTLSLGLLATGYGYVYDMVGLTVAVALTSSRGPLPTPLQALALSAAWVWPVLGAPAQLLLGMPPLAPLVLAGAAWAFHARLDSHAPKENAVSATVAA